MSKCAGARHLALEICVAVVVDRHSLSRQLETRLLELADPRDRGLCSELCYGLCRGYFLLQSILKSYLKKPLKSKDDDVRIILLLGLYQLRFTRVEKHAAVNETVNLTRAVGKPWARGLVNAVLRGYQRALQEHPEQTLQTWSEHEHQCAYPTWLQRKISSDWQDQANAVLRAGNTSPPMTLRVDLTRQSRRDCIDQLAQSGNVATEHPLVDSAVVLTKSCRVDELPGFADGLTSVQDASAQLAATLLDLQPGQRVLDACAAPGGKTLHMLQHCEGLKLVALDKDRSRLVRVAENLERADRLAELIVGDAAAPGEWAGGRRFERILLDVPCSASGILRRHPDIRLLRQADDIGRLVREQKRLLNAIWPLLLPGGLLLYSTCSIFKDENEQQIGEFISNRTDCVERPLNPVPWGQGRPVGHQILPGEDNMDGFYYALLEKTA